MKKSDRSGRKSMDIITKRYPSGKILIQCYGLREAEQLMKGVKRLAYEFEPENYNLEFRIDSDKMSFDGRIVITGKKIGRPSQRITFHQNKLKIKTAKLTYLDKKKGPIDKEINRINRLQSTNEVRLHSAEILYPGKYLVEIEFSGEINERMHGIYSSAFSLAGTKEKIVSTQFESHHAREAFPCIDEPAAKATFDLTLVTVPGVTVLSNTPAKNQLQEDNRLITSFGTTPKMSTYLLAFVIGKMKYKEATTGSNITIRSYATPANAELLDFSVNVARQAVDFYEHYFGVKYPLQKLDMVAIPEFSSGAMENWGLITYRESCMLVDEKTSGIDSLQFSALVICHEIAHQWFGNLVTMEWWDDLWLNESFANLMEYRAVDQIFPEWNIWENFVSNEVMSALRRDSLPKVQAVRTTVSHPDEISTLFDPSIVYAKGSVLLHMLMRRIGEGSFRDGLKDYFERFAYGNTRGDDLWESLSRASKKDLKAFMYPWLTKPGFPMVTVDYVPGDNHATVTQERLAIGHHEDDLEMWPIPLAANFKLQPSMLEKKSEVVEVEAGSVQPLLLNKESNSYFVANYVNRSHFQSILKAVSDGQVEAIDRAILLQNYILLERASLAPTTSNLQLLLSYSQEKDETVWSMMTGIISTTRRLVFATDGENVFKEFTGKLVSPLIKSLGWDGQSAEDSQTRKLRETVLALGASSELKELIDEGLRRFRSFSKPSDLSPDIRGVVYFIGARFGSQKDFDKLLKLHNTVGSADEKDEISSALTSTKEDSQLELLFNLLRTEEVRLQDVPTWFAHLISNPYAKASAWQWLRENWQWLEEKYGDDKSYDRFPRYAGSIFSKVEELENYKDFFVPKSDIPALRRAIQLGIEEIEGRVKWRQLNEKPTIDWLKNWRIKKL